MASLQIPLAIWKDRMTFNVRCCLAQEKEGYLFLGLDSGRIARLRLDGTTGNNITDDGHTSTVDAKSTSPPPPSKSGVDFLLVGHAHPVVTLLASTITSDQETSVPVLLSLDRHGEVAQWSISDGRCLLDNVAALEGGPGLTGGEKITAVGMNPSPNGAFLFIYGHASVVNVLRSSTLETVQSIALPADCWVASVATVGTGAQVTVILSPPASSRQRLWKLLFDETNGRITSGPSPLLFSPLSISDAWPISVEFSCGLKSGAFLADQHSCWFGSFLEDGKMAVHLVRFDPCAEIIRLIPSAGASNEGQPSSDTVCIILSNGTAVIHNMEGQMQAKLSLPPIQPHYYHEIVPWQEARGWALLQILPQSFTLYSLATGSLILDRTLMPIKLDDITCSALQRIPPTNVHHGHPHPQHPEPDRYALLHGYTNGTIQMCASLGDGLLSFSGVLHDRRLLPHVHRQAICCLSTDLQLPGLLASGDMAGMVVLYDTVADVHLATWCHHFDPIIAILRIASQDKTHIIMTIDEAGRCSLGDINMDSRKCSLRGFLGSRHCPIRNVRWAGTAPDATDSGDLRVALTFRDDRLQLWNITSGVCERECSAMLPGLEETLQPLTTIHWMTGAGMATNAAAHLVPIIPDTSSASPSAAAAAAAAVTPRSTMMVILGSCLSWRPTSCHDPIQMLLLDVRRLLERIKSVLSNSAAELVREQIRDVLSLVISILLPWGLDADLDGTAHRLGFGRPRRDLLVGMLGANGNVAFPSPLLMAHQSPWSLSSTMSATLYLAISAIFELPLDFGEEWDRLRMTFASRIMDVYVDRSERGHHVNGENRSGNGGTTASFVAIPVAALPSFAFGSKYWHDLSEELRHASRLMIVQTLARLDQTVLQSIAHYWTALLPSNEAVGERRMNRAAIILGILAVHQPEILDSTTCRLVADSLMGLLMDEKRNLFRAAAIELIGRAFPIWERHVKALAVFRLLLGWLASMSQIDESGGSVAQLVVPFESAATLDTLDAVRETLLKLAAAAPAAIIPDWLSHDFVHARTLIERWTTISLLSDLIRQRVTIVKPYIPLVAETACRLVEGSSSGASVASGSTTTFGTSKHRLIAIATPLVMDMLRAYPTVAYHRETFRMAAAADNRLLLFELRGSSGARNLEGHTQPITAVSFHPEGRLLLSYSAGEATLRWWSVPGGLSGFLAGGIIKPTRTDVVEPALTEAFLTHQRELPEDAIEEVRFDWSPLEERQVRIMIADSVISLVAIPNGL